MLSVVMSNLTCAKYNACDDIIIANVTLEEDIRNLCSAAADALDQQQSPSNFLLTWQAN